MQQRGSNGEREDVIDDVQYDELANLPPDFGFISGADMHQQRIEQFPRIITGEEMFEAAFDRGERYLHNIDMFQGCLVSEPKENTYVLRGQPTIIHRRWMSRPPVEQKVKGAKTNSSRLQPGIGAQLVQHCAGRVRGIVEALLERRAHDALVFPPARQLFELAMSFARHTQVEVAHQPKFFVKVAIAERGQHGFAQTQRQGY